MDHKEKEILNLLIENSRYSDQEIGSMLKLPTSDVSDVISSLIDRGIIRRFTTVVNDNVIEGFPIKALVELSIRPQKDTGFDSIANRICGFSKVVSHYLVSGKYDFLLVVQGKDHKEIAHFVFDKLATIENVQSTTTHFIFKSYKDHGVLMDDKSLEERIPIMP
ncbi:MAG: Lrp/AsnC family transcriptional regulator [Candidatus Margulisiibacteriota bacterium]